jgi:hypothetical protein
MPNKDGTVQLVLTEKFIIFRLKIRRKRAFFRSYRLEVIVHGYEDGRSCWTISRDVAFGLWDQKTKTAVG